MSEHMPGNPARPAADPLADLLAEMFTEITDDMVVPWVTPTQQAEWLRANRDRVLEALGGEHVPWSTHDGGPGGTSYQYLALPPDRHGAPVWLFPEEGDER